MARVGGKNASLAEIVHNLDKHDVSVPPGFATTADVYWCYIRRDATIEPANG